MKHNPKTRRQFLEHAGTGSLAALTTIALPAITTAIERTDSMKITRIEAVKFRRNLHIGGGSGGEDGAEFFWVRLHTDKGIVGTGETYPYTNGQVGALKDYAQELNLLGRDPRDIEGIWRDFFFQMAMRNAGGADMRVLSALNMAQADILGQSLGVPLYRLLGGKTRPQVRVYNTTTDYWAINNMKMGPDTLKIVTALPACPWGLDPGSMAKHLSGLRAMWRHRPDPPTEGGLQGRSAERIAKALEPYDIMYLEDVMLNTNADALAALASKTSVPLCMSETLATRYEYRPFFERRACAVAMYDVTWCGGVTEAKKIADMAEAYSIPTSPHTCGGPLLFICAAHLSTAVPNFLIMESNYWKWAHQYPYFINNVPVPVVGYVKAPEAPGIGAEIRPEIFRNGDAIVETVAAA